MDAPFRPNDGVSTKPGQLHQERLIAASKQRCGEYITKIKGGQAWSRFGLGVFTTMVTGAAAILTGGAASALSTVGAVSSGGRAEMDAQLFAEKAVEVISGGIDRRREKIYKGIREKQRSALGEYNLAAAVGDAVDYHAACTLSAGLSEVGESVTLARDPGLKKLSEVLGVPAVDLVATVRDAMLDERLKKLKEQKEKGLIDDATLKSLQKSLIESTFPSPERFHSGPTARRSQSAHGQYVDKILKGANPADLRIDQPTRSSGASAGTPSFWTRRPGGAKRVSPGRAGGGPCGEGLPSQPQKRLEAAAKRTCGPCLRRLRT